MDAITADLIAALRERLALIADDSSRQHAEAHMERLRAVSEQIEGLQSRLPAPIDPQLQHFLQRRSYSKALEFLIGT